MDTNIRSSRSWSSWSLCSGRRENGGGCANTPPGPLSKFLQVLFTQAVLSPSDWVLKTLCSSLTGMERQKGKWWEKQLWHSEAYFKYFLRKRLFLNLHFHVGAMWPWAQVNWWLALVCLIHTWIADRTYIVSLRCVPPRQEHVNGIDLLPRIDDEWTHFRNLAAFSQM